MKKIYFFVLVVALFSSNYGVAQSVNSYNLGDNSTFTNTGTQWDPVTSTTSPDGKLRTQAATSLWHSAGYGVAFQNGNSLEVDVEGIATIRFYGSVYSSGTMDAGTTAAGSYLTCRSPGHLMGQQIRIGVRPGVVTQASAKSN